MFENAKVVFLRGLDFKGRSDRYELWSFVWLLFLTSIALTIFNSVVFGPTVTEQFTITIENGVQREGIVHHTSYDSGWFGTVLQIVVALPLLAVCWRRIQDLGRPNWIVLAPFAAAAICFGLFYVTSETVPLDLSSVPEGLEFPTEVRAPSSGALFITLWLFSAATLILTIVLLARPSQPGPNKYGPNPHEVPS
ncbi:MAG: DUF805 domain-containing protein [Shimia sp.]|uniref:DUF805 domain-containing protein n=1 Tax=Shimia sp. TaxID=1954381 RepID=UPI0025CC9AC7|nr:DUF805 domain-containing protein [Shimia sp.]MCH2067638.1 DUF805 domain-containing protein [Shimia sp.]